MATREDTGKIMLDALQGRRTVLLEVVKEIETRLSTLQGLVADRDQLVLDIQSIDDEISSVSAAKKIAVLLEVVPQ